MPLNENDPRYRAEVTPQAIRNMEVPLCSAYGVGLDAFGAKGNTTHLSGFHRSHNWLISSPDSRYGFNDYSIQGSRNQGGNWDWVSAFDFTPGAWGSVDNRNKMITITKRVRAAARANDHRLADLYEFAGTEDGHTVVTFYGQGGGSKTPFDSSHLDHVHGSFWRDGAANDHSGLLAVMLGTVPDLEDEDDMGQSFGPIEIQREGTTSLCIPPVQQGIADPRQAWLNICNDGGPYALRLWLSDGANWHPIPEGTVMRDEGGTLTKVGPDGLLTCMNGKRYSFQLPAGTSCVSITRRSCVGDVATGEPLPPFAGHLTVCVERA